MSDDQIKQRLAALGFFSQDVSLGLALLDYQRFFGLKADAVAGPVTQRHLEMPRFCSLPDKAPFRASLLKFPNLEVTYANAHAVPGFSIDETQAVTDMAIAEWNDTSGLRATRTTNTKTATILLTVGRIDGQSSTLAWSELARLPQTTQRYDDAEPWKRGQGWNAIAYPYIDLLLVMAHELGHAFGLDHAPGQDNLLSPIYSPQNTRPGRWEIDQMQQRYGKPRPKAEPPKVDPAPPAGEGLLVWIPGGRVMPQ